jgi:hypothetical protein
MDLDDGGFSGHDYVGSPNVKGWGVYYIAAMAVIAGALLSFWGYKNKAVTAEDYIEITTELVGFGRSSGSDSLELYTSQGEYFVSADHLTRQDLDAILSADWSPRQAVIWLESPGGSQVMGVQTKDLEIDRYQVAALERESYRRFMNGGFIFSGVGVFLFILHYFTPDKRSV